MRRKTWALAAASNLIALAAAGGVVLMSGAKQATAAARQLPVGIAQLQKRMLSAMVSQPGP